MEIKQLYYMDLFKKNDQFLFFLNFRENFFFWYIFNELLKEVEIFVTFLLRKTQMFIFLRRN